MQVYSFAPYNIAAAAFLSIALLLYSLNGQSLKQSFLRGGLFGIGLFGIGVTWIYISIFDHGGGSVYISSFITAAFVLILSSFTALLGWMLNKFWPQANVKRTLIAFPALWVAIEILRGWIFTGFPWLFLGYSQFSTHLLWLAPIGSVWLISWAVAFNGAVLYEIFRYVSAAKPNRKYLYKLLGSALIIWIGAGSIHHKNWNSVSDELTVAMVQANIPQALRWDNTQIQNIANTYSALTAEHLDVDLIIWPESAIPVPLPGSTAFFKEMSQLALSSQAGFISGVPVQVENQNKFYNGMVSLGQGNGLYYKKHLVPFGEYVPLEKMLRGIISFFDLPMSQFISGEKQPPMMTKGYTVAPAICYEIAYPFTIRDTTQKAHMIVTISNDAWFGNSLGPKQHLQMAQMRAIETGRYVLRATNSGISAIINNMGEIKERIPSFEEKVLVGSFKTAEGKTPWLIMGPWLLGVWLIALFLISLLPEKKRKK